MWFDFPKSMSPRQTDYDYTAIRFFLNCRRGFQLFSKKRCRSEEALEVKGNSEAGDSSFSNVFFCWMLGNISNGIPPKKQITTTKNTPKDGILTCYIHFQNRLKMDFGTWLFFESKLKGRLQEPPEVGNPLVKPRLKLRTKGTKQRTPWALAPRLLWVLRFGVGMVIFFQIFWEFGTSWVTARLNRSWDRSSRFGFFC